MECRVKQSGRGDRDAPWFTTVNGHVEPASETAGVAAVQQPPPPSSSLMQPFVMRQEPPPPPAAPASPRGGAAAAAAGTEGAETAETQFAACQLVLPVVRPIRDQLTVEFSVTPVSSD